MRHFKTVGIIGLGSFGAFAAACIARQSDCTLYGYDPNAMNAPEHIIAADLAVVASTDVVILAIPLAAYADVLPAIRSYIQPETLLVDICSVKVYPEQYFAEYFPGHQNVLLSHPLFGPQSAADTTVGHKLIVTLQRGEKAAAAISFCKQELGLVVSSMSSEEHDQHMVRVHVLTMFVARGLSNLQLEAETFSTPSYTMITDLIDFDRTHSNELFQTVQRGNPYAADMCQRVTESFLQLAQELQKQPEERYAPKPEH